MDSLSHLVRMSVDLAPRPVSLPLVVVGEEVRGEGRGCRRRGRGDVHHRRHGDRTLIPRTTEAGDGLFVTTVDRWGTTLLQADDVAAEAEAEVARIVTWDLLCGHVDFAAVATGARTEGGLLIVLVVHAAGG